MLCLHHEPCTHAHHMRVTRRNEAPVGTVCLTKHMLQGLAKPQFVRRVMQGLQWQGLRQSTFSRPFPGINSDGAMSGPAHQGMSTRQLYRVNYWSEQVWDHAAHKFIEIPGLVMDTETPCSRQSLSTQTLVQSLLMLLGVQIRRSGAICIVGNRSK